MAFAWSYLERYHVREGVLDALLSSREPGVLLVGPYGSGKTALLRDLSEDLQDRGRLVHGAAVTEAGIAHAAAQGTEVLLIDDVDRLDDRTLGLLADAVTIGGLSLVAATRPLLYPDLATRARGLNLSVTEVPALTGAELRSYCTSRLGGHVDDLSLTRIGEATAGLPLLVREAVEAMIRRDQLTAAHGVWRLDGPVLFSTWLGQAAAASLSPLSSDERDLLQLLAITDGLPLPLADALHLHDALERLECRGLLTVPAGDRAVVPSTAGWLSPIVRVSGTEAQRRRLAGSCLRALREPVDRTSMLDPLDTAKLRLTAGRPVDLDDAVTAAGAALDHHDPHWAQRLLLPHRKEPAGSPLLADTLIRQARPRAAEQLLGAAAAATAARARGPLTGRRLDVLVLWLNDLQTAGRTGTGSRRAEDDATKVLLAAASENVSSLLPTLRKQLEGVPLTVREGQRVFLAHLHALLASGQAEAALRAAAEAGETALGQFAPDLRLATLLLRGRALLTVSRVPEALDVARELSGEGRRMRHGLAMAAGLALTGTAHLQQGALGEAEEDLRRALAALHGNEAGWTRVSSLTGLALCRAWRSDADLTCALDEVAAAALELNSPDIDETAALATAQILLIRGQIRPAADHAMRAAERAEDLGRLAAATEALLIAGQAIPDLDLAHRLTQLADDCDYDLPRVHAGYLTALAHRSGAALDASARSYEQRDLRLLAAAASAHAHAHLRTAGEQVTANSAARRLTSLITETGITAPMAWPIASALVPLTVREQEIAALAARGLHSDEIAKQLWLSVRTVENHLQHCYRKLGVNGRAELTEALQNRVDGRVEGAGGST